MSSVHFALEYEMTPLVETRLAAATGGSESTSGKPTIYNHSNDIPTTSRWRRDPLPERKSRSVTGVEYDSRRVRPGTVFVAMKGETSDGNRFIDQAIAAGAVAIVTDSAARNAAAGSRLGAGRAWSPRARPPER